MKNIAFSLVIIMLLSLLMSCDLLPNFGGTGDNGNGGNPSEGQTGQGDKNDDSSDVTPGIDPDDKGEDSGDGNTPPLEDSDDKNNLISVNEIIGLNEQIYVSIEESKGVTYKVFYKNSTDEDYVQLDENLMIENDGKIECYVLGIKKDKYDIKIEAESKNGPATKRYSGIEVSAQDRSGYAHFNYEEGIGAYNNDGTVKNNTTILYVNNENKNTITMTIKGVEYVGLVDIMQKLHQVEDPVLIRIIGKITTNQWNYKNVEPRLIDNSNWDDSFFDNTFSTEYGENLVGLKVRYSDKCAGKTYTYKTTANGLGDVREGGSSKSTTNYKGSDFPSLKGKTVYDDDSYINMIEVQAAKNITIEGVGSAAEFFQFGVGFENCESIEVKNLTFTNYPEDALNFMSKDAAVTDNGHFWVHNNTFNNGYNAWDVSGERDKYMGDGSIDMVVINSMTLSYNRFNECKKTMLVGNSESSRCMNISIHHNYFYRVSSRLPLCRNSNVHLYNNFFMGCSTCSSVRANSYLFSESNFYDTCSKPYDISSSAVKSYGDIFLSPGSITATVVTNRTQTVSNNCKPDMTTDYSKFDTNPELFYYDAEKGVTDADYLLSAEDVPEFVLKYAGVGVMSRLP